MREAFVAARGEVGVEGHGDVADEEAPRRFYRDAIVVQGDKAVVGHFRQRLPFFGKVLFCIDFKCVTDGIEVKAQVAHDVRNDVAADMVVRIQGDAAQDGQTAGIKRLIVAAARFFVLAVVVIEHGNGAGAEADEIALAVGGVALEVAVESAVFLVLHEAVVGFGEVIKADEVVAGLCQARDAHVKDVEFFGGGGHVGGVHLFLCAEELRQVSVVEECKAIGGEVDDGVNGVRKAGARLQGQAVDEVYGEGVVAECARVSGEGEDVGEGLNAVDGALYVGVDVLYAEAYAVEAHVA